MGRVLCGGYFAVLVGVVGLNGEEHKRGKDRGMGMGYDLEGMRNVGAMVVFEEYVERWWVMLRCISHGVGAFCS